MVTTSLVFPGIDKFRPAGIWRRRARQKLSPVMKMNETSNEGAIMSKIAATERAKKCQLVFENNEIRNFCFAVLSTYIKNSVKGCLNI